jgi:SAM-dependent methyltransferase
MVEQIAGSGEDRPVSVGVGNVEQAAAWDGEEGERWVEQEQRYEASSRRYTPRLFDAAQISAEERVLDVGCGCGESTREAARRARAGMALGVDLSARMLERARQRSRAEGLMNVRFEQADAQVYPFDEQSFDLAISRFGAMFFGDPVAAFRNIQRALRPGGRLALLAWQAFGRNEWLTALRGALAAGRTLPEPPAGVPGPFGLADPDLVQRILTESGFESIGLEEVSEPVWFGTDAADTFAFVRTLGITKGMLDGLDAATTARALEAVETTISAHVTDEGVIFNSRAWLITARRL